MSDALDLSDPHVRAMADRSHEPDEMWNMGGKLVSVHCRTYESMAPAVQALLAEGVRLVDEMTTEQQAAGTVPHVSS